MDDDILNCIIAFLFEERDHIANIRMVNVFGILDHEYVRVWC